MRIFLQVTFACLFALLALPLQTLAAESNAAKVDAATWGYMYQVMSGTSTTTPDQLPAPLNILTPQGLYVIIDANALYTEAGKVSGVTQHEAFKNYLTFIVGQPGVAGLMFAAPWSMLNPVDPGTTDLRDVAYDFHALNIALQVVGDAGKTIQVTVSPGAHAPSWLYDHLTSCDFVFAPSLVATPTTPAESAACGYTEIFDNSEGLPAPAQLPMPWNNIYKAAWKHFLKELKGQIHGMGADGYAVSINVAGPTMVSGEMMLPRKLSSSLPAGYYLPTYTPLTAGPMSPPSANAAWNCLLENHYGLAPASGAHFLNSDRAFIEEWAAAIDTYGEVFSGLTLTVATANALPDFSKEPAGFVTCNSGRGFLVAAPDSISPPPAFVSDCGTDPLFAGDCAAETAILAYFAQPSVGGPNAKATQEDALSASDDVVSTLLTLSNASVKWLSHATADGLATMPASNPLLPPALGAAPVASRMLGGLQFTGPAFTKKDPSKGAARIGCPNLACAIAPSTEQALLNALQQYFAGTSAASAFGAPDKIMNNGTAVRNAPLNYLQMWYPDIEYAAGWGACKRADIMRHSLAELTANAATICSGYTPPAGMPTVCGSPLGCVNAQQLLADAGAHIPTTPVALPLFGYNDPSLNTVCKCQAPYVEREAFVGDDVCVSKEAKAQAKSENDNAAANFAIDETSDNIPYGPCQMPLFWRRAQMGDYVCVTLSRLNKVAAENVAGRSHSTCP